MQRTILSQVTATPQWRFLRPLTSSPYRVIFAGSHFHAGLPLVKSTLSNHKPSLHCELIHVPNPQDLCQFAPTAHVAIPFMEHFDSQFFSLAPHLRLVMQFGVGLERVDIPSATKAGIAVSNIPADGSGNAEATSEHALFLILSLLRHAKVDLGRRFRQRELGGLPLPGSLFRKKVTVVGFGNVGRVLCRYLLNMGSLVTVVRQRCWNITAVEGEERCAVREGVGKVSSLEEALPGTDILILVCTTTPETVHLINKKTISMLPQGALIVNVGRGPLVEYDAVLGGLNSGHIGGFASDVGVSHSVKPSEPWDPDDELSNHEKAIFTPHVGGYTDYSYGIMAEKIVDAIDCVVRGEPPPVWVNKG